MDIFFYRGSGKHHPKNISPICSGNPTVGKNTSFHRSVRGQAKKKRFVPLQGAEQNAIEEPYRYTYTGEGDVYVERLAKTKYRYFLTVTQKPISLPRPLTVAEAGKKGRTFVIIERSGWKVHLILEGSNKWSLLCKCTNWALQLYQLFL